MLDYSIGHELILLGQRNLMLTYGFSTSPIKDQIEACAMAALVCCQTWKQNQNPHRWLGLWRWKNKHANYQVEIEAFTTYRNAGIHHPIITDEEADMIANGDSKRGRELGGPHLARLFNFATAIPGYETPFDVPIGLASFLYCTALESAGELKIENQQESEIKSEMMGHREAFFKKKEAACPA